MFMIDTLHIHFLKLSDNCEGGAAGGHLYAPPPPVRSLKEGTSKELKKTIQVQRWAGGKARSVYLAGSIQNAVREKTFARMS